MADLADAWSGAIPKMSASLKIIRSLSVKKAKIIVRVAGYGNLRLSGKDDVFVASRRQFVVLATMPFDSSWNLSCADFKASLTVRMILVK